MNTAVIGASSNPERYSYMAVVLLRELGHAVYPVHPSLLEIDGIRVYASIRDIPDTIDTISMYLSPQNQASISEDIVKSGARRVIFNPGAENPGLSERLEKAGAEVLNACTLVMLKTGQY